MIKCGVIFAGIGGFELGLLRAGGFEIVWTIEIDDACDELLRDKFPHTKRYKDVKECGAHNLDRVDLILAGFPCQGASIAGNRGGLGDPRTGLFYQYTRILNELGTPVTIWENVPGLLSVTNGWDFVAMLREFGRIGYNGGWRVFDAQHIGLAQRRRRIFGVFARNDPRAECAQKILSITEGLRGHPPPRRSQGEKIAGTLTRGALDGSGACGGDGREQFLEIARCVTSGRDGYNEGSDQTYIPDIAGTLGSRSEGGGSRTTNLDGHGAYITDTVGSLTNGAHNGGGSTVRTPTPEESLPCVAWALQERDGKGADSSTKTGHLIPVPIGGFFDDVIAFSSKDHGADAGELSPTLRSGNHDKSHANGGTPPAIAFNWQNGAGYGAAHDGLGITEDGTGPLNRSQVPAVSFEWGVRRLTPLECERLQGFPDGWTAKFCDSTRYKMLGNAVAVNVAEWLAKRARNFLHNFLAIEV